MSDVYCLIPFRRRAGRLQAQDHMACRDEGELFRHGRAMAAVHDGVAFFKIDCRDEGDVWQRVELLTTVGDVPDEEAA